MNAKQALRAASKRIEDLENFNRRAAADIKAYNRVIDGMIAGNAPCEWCMDFEECQRECKGKAGCAEWWLKDIPFKGDDANVENNDSEGIHGQSPQG